MIKKFLFSGIFSFLLVNLLWATDDTKKKDEEKKQSSKGYYLGVGAELSSINIFRNYRQNPYELGFNGRGYYQYSENMRVIAEYTYVPKFNMDPTWLSVTSNVIGANLSMMAKIKDETAMFYTITGICYQRWKGLYTGINDYNVGTKNKLAPNHTYINQYMGLNLGVGFERAFAYDQFFGEFRYRFSKTESGFGITDAAFTAGVKIRINPAEGHKKLHGKYNWF